MRTLGVLLVLALASCASIETTLDKYTLQKPVMDKVLTDASHIAFALSAAFTAADANGDDEVRGLEWIEFVKTAIAQFKDIRGMQEDPMSSTGGSMEPVTLKALQAAGIPTDVVFAVDKK